MSKTMTSRGTRFLFFCMIIPICLCQQFQHQTVGSPGFQNTLVYQDDSAFVQPVGQATVGSGVVSAPISRIQPAVSGYPIMTDNLDDTYTAPVQAQYWSGSQGPIPQYPAQNYYQPYYGPVAPMTPQFHPQYWTGPYPQHVQQPYYQSHGFYSGPQYSPVYQPVYPKHPGMWGNPLPKKRMGGLTKTLLGAAVVGVVAGAVARGK